MNIWKRLPERVQKRLAHARSQFMKISGIRQSRLELVRANRRLRGENGDLRNENDDFRTSIDAKVRDGVGVYTAEARRLMAEHGAATSELVSGAMSRNIPHMPEKTKAHYVPNSTILPIVIGTLSAGDRRFRNLPLSIWHEGTDVYTSHSFSRACGLSSGELGALIDDHAQDIGSLKHGKAYTLKSDEFDLVVRRLEAPGIDDVNSVGIYAVPNADNKKRAAKVIRDAGSDAVSSIRKSYRRLATPDDVGGLDYGTI